MPCFEVPELIHDTELHIHPDRFDNLLPFDKNHSGESGSHAFKIAPFRARMAGNISPEASTHHMSVVRTDISVHGTSASTGSQHIQHRHFPTIDELVHPCQLDEGACIRLQAALSRIVETAVEESTSKLQHDLARCEKAICDQRKSISQADKRRNEQAKKVESLQEALAAKDDTIHKIQAAHSEQDLINAGHVRAVHSLQDTIAGFERTCYDQARVIGELEAASSSRVSSSARVEALQALLNRTTYAGKSTQNTLQARIKTLEARASRDEDRLHDLAQEKHDLHAQLEAMRRTNDQHRADAAAPDVQSALLQSAEIIVQEQALRLRDAEARLLHQQSRITELEAEVLQSKKSG